MNRIDPQLRFFYFNFPFWRAEVCRVALVLGDVPFEDVRVSREEWKEYKESGVLKGGISLPFGQLPALEIDGKIFAQTGGIARYCGKISGLYPETDRERCLRIDQVFETADDITRDVFFSGQHPEEKEESRKKLAAVTLPKWFGYLEALSAENGEGPWCVGDSLTLADVALWRIVDWLSSGIVDGVPTTICDPYPRLLTLKNALENLPKVQAWKSATFPRVP